MKRLLDAAGREIVWRVTIGLLFLLFRLCARVRVTFFAPLPSGAFILATNHISHFDPPVITPLFPRKIDWIAMRELFGTPWSRWYFTSLNVIEVDRSGADRKALRTAVRRLEEGRVVGIFPEGGIRAGARSIVHGATMKSGMALLGVLSGAPVVPGVILGSERLYNRRNWLPWCRARIWVGYGAPISPPANLSGAEKRAFVEREFAASIIALKDRMVRDFRLGGEDLPHSPQERMAEP